MRSTHLSHPLIAPFSFLPLLSLSPTPTRSVESEQESRYKPKPQKKHHDNSDQNHQEDQQQPQPDQPQPVPRDAISAQGNNPEAQRNVEGRDKTGLDAQERRRQRVRKGFEIQEPHVVPQEPLHENQNINGGRVELQAEVPQGQPVPPLAGGAGNPYLADPKHKAMLDLEEKKFREMQEYRKKNSVNAEHGGG